MNLPGFKAEASIYATRRHYCAGADFFADNGCVYPAQQACPPECVQVCEKGCRADGLSQGFCAQLCQRDCGAYSSGQTVSCGPCVNSVQTCTVCGGGTVTRSCGGVSCGDTVCPMNYQCCDGNTCCPSDATCCHDGHGCCPAGQHCESVSWLGLYYCLPNWVPL